MMRLREIPNGHDIRALRHRLGWTQAQLAAKLGVARNTVNRWEMGLHVMSRQAERTIQRLMHTRRVRRPAHGSTRR